MTIRFAETRDIPGMIELLKQVGQVHHDIRPDLFRDGAQKYSPADLEALLLDPARPILIADMDGKVAGYCFCILQVTEGNPVLCDRKVLYIDDLCVDEGRRGTGIATALYAKTLEYAKSLGCHSVTLNVWCGNDSAMRFYEKCGMKPQKIGMEFTL
jgi:ribosomal protein S18 acetylase RimI-like enzyme